MSMRKHPSGGLLRQLGKPLTDLRERSEKKGRDVFRPCASQQKELVSLLFALYQALHHRRIGERGGIAEILYLPVGDLPEDPAHDLAAARLGESGSELELVRGRDRPDDRADVAGEDLLELVRRLLAVLQGHIDVDALALDVVRVADHGRFRDRLVADQRGLDLGSAEPVAADVDDVIDAAHEPVVAVLVDARPVPRKVPAREPAEIDFLDALVLRVSIGAPEHAGPGLVDAEVAALVYARGRTVLFYHLWHDPREGLRRRTWFGRNGSGKPGDQDA